MTQPATEPLLDEAQAAFLMRGVSIVASARSAENVPSVARAHGCVIEPDRRSVTIFLTTSEAADVAANVRSNGAVAVVFCQPSTFKTIQLKGRDARVRDRQPEDRATIAAYGAAFAADLAKLGYRDEFLTAIRWSPWEEIFAIQFTLTDAFAQTPGPGAGGRLTRQIGGAR